MQYGIRLFFMLIWLIPSCGTEKNTTDVAPPLSGFSTAYEEAKRVKLPKKAPEEFPSVHHVFQLSPASAQFFHERALVHVLAVDYQLLEGLLYLSIHFH